MDGDIGPMTGKDVLAERFPLYELNSGEAADNVFGGVRETTDTTEEV